jgi:hypothetical protein
MKLNVAMPIVGSVVGSAADLSASCRGLGRFTGCGMDEAITDVLAMFPTLDQMLDLASQVVARRSDHGKA